MNLKKAILQLKENLLDVEKPHWILGCIIVMGMILLISHNQRITTTNATGFSSSPTPDPSPIDTFVPTGFVLVTLQLTNGDSIDSMMGNYGMVDLYPAASNNFILSDPDKSATSQKTLSPSPIATHLRIIRAPNNQKLFGVLVPEGSRTLIQLLSVPVFAVIHKPDATPPTAATATTLPTKKSNISIPSRAIQYGDLL